MRFSITYLLLLLAFTTKVAAQTPTWQSLISAATVRSSDYALVSGTAVNASGDVYISGTFTGTLRFGAIDLSSRVGSQDIFVAKWSPVSSSFVWAQRAGGIYGDYATGLAVNGTSLYVTGEFDSPVADFGLVSLSPVRGPSGATSRDIFVAKLTDAGSSGSFIWAQAAGSMYPDVANAVAVAGANVYVAGYVSGPATFGSLPISPAGGSAAFVTKLTDAGSSAEFTWIQQGSGTDGFITADGLAVSGTDVYVTGSFGSRTVTFGTTTLPNAGATGSYDLFLAKVRDAGPSGSVAWARRAGGAQDELAASIAVQGSAVYVAGQFSSAVVPFDNTSLTRAGSDGYDMLVAKLTDAGNSATFTWAQRGGSTGNDYASQIAATAGGVYVVGGFTSPTVTLGNNTLVNTSTSNRADVFVTKMVDMGNTATFTWAQQTGGADREVANALAVNEPSIYVGGYAIPPATFGPFTLAGSTSEPVAYLATLRDNTILRTQELVPTTSIHVYPNPATTTVHMTGVPVGSQVRLVDALGRFARTTTVTADATISLQGMTPGLYTLQAIDPQNHRYSSRFVVE